MPPPGPHRNGGLGFRIPLIVVSPFAKGGYVSHEPYQFGSVVRFIEDNWSLGRLGTTDSTSATSLTTFSTSTRNRVRFVPSRLNIQGNISFINVHRMNPLTTNRSRNIFLRATSTFPMSEARSASAICAFALNISRALPKDCS